METINFKDYKILKLLGKGGMATVYLAEHRLLQNKVAIKVLNKEFIYNSNIKNNFISEARKLAQLNHPNIVRVTDLLDNEDQVAFVMEYFEGKSLKETLEQKKLNDEEIELILKQMIAALSYVHEEGLIHGNIKPSNFIFDNKGNLKLTDFGISIHTSTENSEYTQTATHINMGTPMYMSPEQIRSLKEVTKLTDIYSLGVVLWEMASGKKPYNAQTLSSFDLQTKIVNESLPLTYTKWDVIVQKATEKAEEDRLDNLQLFLKPELIEVEVSDLVEDVEKTIISTVPRKEPEQEKKVPKEAKKKNRRLDYLTIVIPIVFLAGLIVYPYKNQKVADNKDLNLSNSDFEIFTLETLEDKEVVSLIDKKDIALRERYFKKYDYVWNFNDGLAAVRLNGKAGFIDKSGKEVIPIKYDLAGKFEDELAIVRLNYKYSLIDKSGKEIAPLKYDYIDSFHDGLAFVTLNDKFGYIDRFGEEITPIKYDNTAISGFNEGLAPIKLNGKWGFIDKSGREITPIKYDQASDFSEGLALVKLNGRSGYIDKSGKETIPLKYNYANNFSEGLARIKLNGKEGFIDKYGQEVILTKYDWAGNFSEGLAQVGLNDKYGFIDKKGNEVISLKYENANHYGFSEGLVTVQLNGKWGFINKAGKEITSFKYDTGATGFSEGLAAVNLYNKWGFIDKSGNEVIPIKYDRVESFKDGFARVTIGRYPNEETFYINKKGECVSRNCP